MASPDSLNWINRGIREVTRILRATPELMDGSALPGGRGVVARVDEHELDRDRMPEGTAIYAAVRWGGNRLSDFNTAGSTDYTLAVTVHLEARLPITCSPAERMQIWSRLQRAVAVLPLIAARENRGGRFNGISGITRVTDSDPGDDVVEEEAAYYPFTDTAFLLEVTLPDDE